MLSDAYSIGGHVGNVKHSGFPDSPGFPEVLLHDITNRSSRSGLYALAFVQIEGDGSE